MLFRTAVMGNAHILCVNVGLYCNVVYVLYRGVCRNRRLTHISVDVIHLLAFHLAQLNSMFEVPPQ